MHRNRLAAFLVLFLLPIAACGDQQAGDGDDIDNDAIEATGAEVGPSTGTFDLDGDDAVDAGDEVADTAS